MLEGVAVMAWNPQHSQKRVMASRGGIRSVLSSCFNSKGSGGEGGGESSVVVHAVNPRTQEAEDGGCP